MFRHECISDPVYRERFNYYFWGFPTRREAEAALNEYFENPYDLDGKDMIFKELFKEWFKQHAVISGVVTQAAVFTESLQLLLKPE